MIIINLQFVTKRKLFFDMNKIFAGIKCLEKSNDYIFFKKNYSDDLIYWFRKKISIIFKLCKFNIKLITF